MMVRFLLLFMLLPNLLMAQSDAACEELWFARNAMASSAGYCFSSPLGQAVFDNADCTTSSPAVGAQATIMVNRILAQEADRSCRVDTDQPQFQTIRWPTDPRLDLALRLDLDVQPPEPADSLNEFSCMDRVGEAETVFAAPDRNARVLGAWRPGGDLRFQHDILLQDETLASLFEIFYDEGAFPGSRGWVFGHVQNDDGPGVVGWLFLPHSEYLAPLDTGGVCGRIAG
ncbi:YARHG domain-containing protein [Yoonia sp. BS5-3]|uniref:YARHG domain-containing protein n=1 Tax=Yoonia phaeophyticola TaxID=3137369 RepID=A0ABZ2V5R6_9RHOB